MIVKDDSKIKINPENLLDLKFNVPDTFKRMCKDIKYYLPDLKIEYPILNCDLKNMYDYVIICRVKSNPKLYFINVAVRLSGLSTHSYEYISQFGDAMKPEFFDDFAKHGVGMPVNVFNGFLESIEYHTFINRDPKKGDVYNGNCRIYTAPNGTNEYINGLSVDRSEPNFFLSSNNLKIFLDNVSSIKISTDNAKKNRL